MALVKPPALPGTSSIPALFCIALYMNIYLSHLIPERIDLDNTFILVANTL